MNHLKRHGWLIANLEDYNVVLKEQKDWNNIKFEGADKSSLYEYINQNYDNIKINEAEKEITNMWKMYIRKNIFNYSNQPSVVSTMKSSSIPPD